MKTALITGITGQDGAYLSELLLRKDYRVVGLTRSYNSANLFKLEYLGVKQDVIIEECDLQDISSIIKTINKYAPTEIYNLSAQSSVGLSFSQPIGTIQYNIVSVLNLLEAIRMLNPNIRFYQASSSEMFGKVNKLPITESTVFHPLSPYAVSKSAAHWSGINYRESYNLFISCDITFNHESYLRSPNFFVNKVITDSIAISKGKKDCLRVGNIEVSRDFGYAPKYVEAMWLMLQQDIADDFIICSNKSIMLRDIILYIFDKLNIPKDKLIVDKNLYRPNDIKEIYGDSTKIKKQLNWSYDLDFFNVLDLLLPEFCR
jgi:GDPmannose 4,6-dehydratase